MKIIKTLVIIIILTSTGCTGNIDKKQTDELTTRREEWINKKINENHLKELYKTSDGRTIYSKYLEIIYKDGDNNINLKEALGNQKISIDSFIEKLKLIDASNDGGSRYYEFQEEQTNTTLYLARCNSLEGNGGIEDIFIDNNEEAIYDYCVIE